MIFYLLHWRIIHMFCFFLRILQKFRFHRFVPYFSGNAVGWGIEVGQKIVDESRIVNGFLVEVLRKWQKQTQRRLVICYAQL